MRKASFPCLPIWPARDSYLRKLLDINDVDPYEVPAKQWCKDFASLPPISHGDLFNYFVFGVSQYTLQEFKAFKTLESYKQFVDGWVQEIYTHKPANCNNTVIAAKVMHSMRLNEKLLKPWIIADADGTIISAHCDCVAGVGETCTHVGAVLFKVDAIVRCREKTTVTGVPAY
ncbi:uncharacterized protein LOC108671493 [Hyalella azteca]|uniref:Uncharacterized protein LOC108671493 n=1 Tax=Hyalella azteca TaxID=294128 RepID=A0A8B7NLI9_HYAAZ|nr:uncharacterized protein LOC108671493 [Hyalella azteca]